MRYQGARSTPKPRSGELLAERVKFPFEAHRLLQPERLIYANRDTTAILGSFDRAATSARQLQKLREEVAMSNVEQFQKAVTDAGAVAMRIIRQPNGSERLVIQTPGGLITREVPLRGDLGQDVQAATTSAREIVASARHLTSPPARKLTSRTNSDKSAEPVALLPSRAARRP